MKKLFILLIINMLVTKTFAQKLILNTKIEAYLTQLPPEIKISMAVENLDGKIIFELNQTQTVPAASIIKVPIMVELMEQVKIGKVDLGELYEILPNDKVGGSGTLANQENTKALTIKQLCQKMISVSDNTSTNILIKKLGMEAINKRLEILGMTKTRLNRMMMDTEAVKAGRENWVNALEINGLLQKISHKKVANEALCNLMMDILVSCDDNSTIPNKLPKTLKIAHKTGGLPYIRGDAAIVFAPKPYIISVFVEGFKNIEDAEKIIANLSEICYLALESE